MLRVILKHALHPVIPLSPYLVLKKVVRKVRREVRSLYRHRLDTRRSTYSHALLSPPGTPYRYLGDVPVDSLYQRAGCIAALTEHYINHRFDLLGSGWVQVKHGVCCRGVEGYRYEMGSTVDADREGHWLEGRINPANVAEARRIWRLVDESYVPIDWHVDVKSGYRWSEKTWYRKTPYAHKLGVDIKVPWELARMQHLPQLSLAYALGERGQQGFAQPYVYLREFRNQVLDFIATNPPRFGVNWHCTMDV
ncbi:MAG: hypothetical protein HY709_00850, partial [Candidatus Latescibacteria bacterium]|nr:hypothetical protein [Candidatus Latescibacterota bacterium]